MSFLITRANNAPKNIFALGQGKLLNRPLSSVKKLRSQYLITNNNLLFAKRVVKLSEPWVYAYPYMMQRQEHQAAHTLKKNKGFCKD